MKKPKYRFFSKRTSSYYHGKCSQKSLILILVLCVVPCTSQDSSLPETPICKKKKTRVCLSLSLSPPSRFVLLFSFLPRSFSLSLRETNSLLPPPKKKLSLCLSCVYALEREGKKPPPIFSWNSDGTPFFLNPEALGPKAWCVTPHTGPADHAKLSLLSLMFATYALPSLFTSLTLPPFYFSLSLS